MININTKKTLNIVLPNTNKALKEVLQSASPKELEALNKGKDLNSILNNILKQSNEDSSQNRLLLNLTKNNPTLKELGGVSSSVKELRNTLQQEKTPLPLEKQLQSFLSDIKNISEKTLQAKIENSGVFLENKIKNLQNPKQELKELLTELSKQLSSSKIPEVKVLNTQVKELLASDTLKNIPTNDLLTNSKTDLTLLATLSKKVENILASFTKRLTSQVDRSISPNDVVFSKETKVTVDKLQLLSKPEQLLPQAQAKEMFSQDFKAILLKTHEEINSSNHPNRQELLKQIDKLVLQIDYHQLVSHLSNATSLYVPFSWDALEDGNISIKNTQDGKFFTDIELELKEYGQLKLRLGLFEKNQLNMNITTQNREFKKLLKENIPALKKQLFAAGITPSSIRFLDEDTTISSAYSQDIKTLNSGFEVKA